MTHDERISREVEFSGAAVSIGVLIVCAALLVVAGVLWLGDARDDIRATRRAVEVTPCR